MSEAPTLVLASGSPRRTQLLTMLGIEHEVVVAGVPEELQPGESPEAHVERLARDKAEAVHRVRPDAWVLGGDTEVILDGRPLSKPSDPEDAVEMLLRLAGREHTVLSGIALRDPRGPCHSSVEATKVRFRDFGPEVARGYVATREPLDKAGAYGIQGLGAALVTSVEGDYYTVVGLPVSGLLRLLRQAGLRYAFGPLEWASE